MNAPYLLIPLGLIMLILYGISHLFTRLAILTGRTHRRIWNYALLVTFLVAAGLGILMAIQVNYRMKVPWTETALKYHVNFSIAMTIIGVFHLIWHWRYYLPLRHSPVPGEKPNGKPGLIIRISRLSPATVLFLTGFEGIFFQTLMIREIPSLFQGNEMTLSLLLFVWLLTTGGGALTGNRARIEGTADCREEKRPGWLLLTLFLLPILLVPMLFYARSLLFAPGIEAGPLALAGFLFLILGPFCFISGFTFTYLIRLYKPSGFQASRAYAWESFGGAAAGLTATLAILAGVFSPPGMRFFEKLFHPNDQILVTASGPSGRITVTGNSGQINVFENGTLSQSSGNTLICEETAHFAMLCHPAPRNVLVIGGLLSGVEAELEKYTPNRIDFAEPDKQLFRLARKLRIGPQPRPPVTFLANTRTLPSKASGIRYDVVLVMLPGPVTLGLNRFYTLEFFERLKESLTERGVVSIRFPGSANYLSEEALSAIQPVMNAMRNVFPQVILFPGENNYLIAGDFTFNGKVLEELGKRNIEATYLSAGYFDEALFVAKLNQANQLLGTGGPANTDLQPRAFLGQTEWWLSHFRFRSSWPLTAILVSLFLVSLFTRRHLFPGIFLLAAGAGGMEVILLLLLQISAGSLYLLNGLLLACFMAGMAFGALRKSDPAVTAGNRLNRLTLSFIGLSALTAGFALLVPVVHRPVLPMSLIILMLGFSTAYLSGRFFAVASGWLSGAELEGRLYLHDLLGAASGSLLYPLLVIPGFGLLSALLIISGSGIVILFLRRLMPDSPGGTS